MVSLTSAEHLNDHPESDTASRTLGQFVDVGRVSEVFPPE